MKIHILNFFRKLYFQLLELLLWLKMTFALNLPETSQRQWRLATKGKFVRSGLPASGSLVINFVVKESKLVKLYATEKKKTAA